MSKAGPASQSSPKKDTMTIVLPPEDVAIKDWLDQELLSAKVEGRLPRTTDRSQLVVLMLRGKYKPTRPAPGTEEPPTAPAPRRKSK